MLPDGAARALRTGLRTAHLVAFGALYGGHVYGAEGEALFPALIATAASGGALALLEISRHPVWLVQVRGLATMLKLGLLLLVPLFWNLRLVWLTAAIVIGGVSSHMPGRFRYYSVAHGRVVGGERG
jgi:hypothetical protein